MIFLIRKKNKWGEKMVDTDVMQYAHEIDEQMKEGWDKYLKEAGLSGTSVGVPEIVNMLTATELSKIRLVLSDICLALKEVNDTIRNK